MRPDFFDSHLQLQISTELNTWPTEELQALSPDEVSDEVTAMSNKLAYLETQMMALQKRNMELEILRSRSAIQQETASSSWVSWLFYALITLLIIAVIGIVEWLRRRHSHDQLAAEAAIWDGLAPTAKLQELGLQDQPGLEPEQINGYSAKPTTAKANLMPPLPAFKVVDDDNEGMGATVNEDILEQAEVFVAHGRANLAIVLLQDHLREFPNLSPAPWLMLLDLLKRDGQSADYESATKECQRYFNVAIEGFEKPLIEDETSIEDFPRIRVQLEEVWGTVETLPFLDDLIFNRRLEARQGFERNAYLEFLLLRSIASDLNFTSVKKMKAPVIPFKARKPENESEKEVLPEASKDIGLNVSNPETSAPDSDSFEDVFESPRLPKDKAQPLDFEIELKTKL